MFYDVVLISVFFSSIFAVVIMGFVFGITAYDLIKDAIRYIKRKKRKKDKQ